MKIIRSDMDAAAKAGIISPDQAQKLWTYFEGFKPDQAKFQALHVLYYSGGILILASMSWFLTNAWDNGIALMLISGFFALMYLVVGNGLWAKQNMKIPGGLLITAAVGLTPVFIFGLQQTLGWWPQEAPNTYRDFHLWIKGCWFFMELGTILASLAALRFYSFTFLTFPLALCLWYMSMDLTPLLFGKNDFNMDDRKIVSCLFGLIILIGSYFIDKKYKKIDFAFWTYLYGMAAFWGGLSMMDSHNEWNQFLYCLLNAGFIFTAVYLRRKVFLVFGTMGVFGYLGHLAWEVFKDSYAFPIILAFFGMMIVYIGIQYQKNKKMLEEAIEKLLPISLMKWRPEERA